MPEEPFTAEQVIAKCEAMKNQLSFQDLDRVLQNRRKLLNRASKVDIKGISEKLENHSPALEVHADLYTNHLDGAELIVEVSARDQDKVEQAQDVENFLYQYYFDLRRKRTGGSYEADRRALHQQAAYLAGIRHLRFSPRFYDMLSSGGKRISFQTPEALSKTITEALEKQEGGVAAGLTENPFIIECPDLRTVFWEPNQSSVCEVGKRKIATIYDENVSIDFKKHGWAMLTSDTVPVEDSEYDNMADVWHLETSAVGDSPGYIYDVVSMAGDTDSDGQAVMLQVIPNFAGRPWYSFAPGKTGSETAVVEGWKPLIAPLYPVVATLNIMRTLAASASLITGRPQWQEVDVGGSIKGIGEYLNTPSEQRPLVAIDLTQEMIRSPKQGKEWKVFPVPDQATVDAEIARGENDIIKYGFPQILSPGAPSEATSGYDRSRQMEPAVNQLKPPLTNHADAWYEIFRLTLDIQQALGLSIAIPVHQRAEGAARNVKAVVKLPPERLSEFDLTIRFRSVPAAQAFADEEADNRKLELGLISKQTWMARRYDDPEAENERIRNDRLEELVDAKVFEQTQIFLDAQIPNIVQEVLAEEGLPLPPTNGTDPSRPAGGGAQPSLGSANEVALAQGQRQPGDVAPPNIGSDAVGVSQ